MPEPQRVITSDSTVDWFGTSLGTSLELVPVPCQDLDTDGMIRRVNSLFAGLLGYDTRDLVGRPVWDLIAAEEIDRAKRGYADKLCGRRPLLPFERVYRHAGGTVLTVQVHDLLIRDRAGTVIGVRSALIDVTEWRRREAELKADNAFAESLIGALPDGIIVADTLGTVLSMNPRAESVTGRAAADSIGRTVEEVLGTLCDGEPDNSSAITGHSLVNDLLASEVIDLPTRTESPLPRASLSCITDSGKAVVGVLVVLR